MNFLTLNTRAEWARCSEVNYASLYVRMLMLLLEEFPYWLRGSSVPSHKLTVSCRRVYLVLYKIKQGWPNHTIHIDI